MRTLGDGVRGGTIMAAMLMFVERETPTTTKEAQEKVTERQARTLAWRQMSPEQGLYEP